jgi:hypothetical protein
MSETTLLTRLVKRLGTGMEQTLRWLLRPYSTHSAKQRELLGESLHVGWSEGIKREVPLHAYANIDRVVEMQEEVLFEDLTTLRSVRERSCSPYEAARLLLFRDGVSGKVKCRYFTRVGPIRAILTSFDGQIRIGRGFRVQIRGQREPARLIVCDKTLAKLVRDEEWRNALFNQIPTRTRDRKPREPSRAKQLWNKTVNDLRQECRDKGIPVSGTKAEVIDRILTSEKASNGGK